VPVELPIEQVRSIAAEVEASHGAGQVTVDLEQQVVLAPSGASNRFTAPEILRQMLLKGVDEIELTLSRSAEIESFRSRDRARRSWAY
jgi:3-isopropylmalate/(R)-2-methylmalate dehydratase small subunit